MSEIEESWRQHREHKQNKRSLAPLCLWCGTRTLDLNADWYDCPRCGQQEFKPKATIVHQSLKTGDVK